MKLKAVRIVPDGSVVEITGPNGAGKSCVLEAIAFALCGKGSLPSVPVRKGEKKASVRLELGNPPNKVDLTVTRRFTAEGGTSLVVESADGARLPSPQSVLDALYSHLAVDPSKFLNMAPAAQLDALRELCPVSGEIDRLDAEYKDFYDQRTEANRKTKILRAQADGIKAEKPPAKGLSPDDILQALKAANQQNEARRQMLARVNLLRGKANAAQDQAQVFANQIESLKKAMAQNIADAEALAEEADQLAVPEAVDTSKLESGLAQANLAARSAGDYERKKDLESQADASHEESATLTECLKALEDDKKRLIEQARMPVAGLGFGEGHVTFNGLPLSQASHAEQLRVAMGIAIATNPKLKIIRLADASLFDEESWKAIGQIADENGYQVWAETVSAKGKPAIELYDGESAGAA